MTKALLTAALIAAILLPAAAQAEGETTFTRSGRTFVYSVTKKDDRTIIAGRETTGGFFRYVVRNGRVTGWNSVGPVNFRAPRPEAASSITLATR